MITTGLRKKKKKKRKNNKHQYQKDFKSLSPFW